MERLRIINPTELDFFEYSQRDLELARELLSLSPQLQEWAQEGYQLGVLKTYDLTRNCITKLYSEFETANHENGHAAVAKALGWEVVSISIVRDGNTLGVTKAVPGSIKPIDQLLL